MDFEIRENRKKAHGCRRRRSPGRQSRASQSAASVAKWSDLATRCDRTATIRTKALRLAVIHICSAR